MPVCRRKLRAVTVRERCPGTLLRSRDRERADAGITPLCASLALAQPPNPSNSFVRPSRRSAEATTPPPSPSTRSWSSSRPDVVEVRANLGAVLAHQGHFDEAIEQYNAASGIRSPDNLGIRFNLALAYYKKSDWAKAAEQLEILHGQQPNDPKTADAPGRKLHCACSRDKRRSRC